MKKKLIALMLCMAMVFSMTACGGSDSESKQDSGDGTEAADDSESDVDYIKGKGTLVIGITEFEPMDYKDESGEWIGFDADMAKLVAKELGVEAEFVVIDWDSKIMELDSKNIDVVWNGMTLTPEVTSAMECTKAYCNNAQVVVVPEDKKGADLADLTFAVEAGSAGEATANDKQFNMNSVASQADALMEVKSGTSDAAIIDLLMAGAMIGEGTSYTDLIYTEELTTEEYGVGCRKGSDLAEFINGVFEKTYGDGRMMETAEAYGVQEAVVEQ